MYEDFSAYFLKILEKIMLFMDWDAKLIIKTIGNH